MVPTPLRSPLRALGPIVGGPLEPPLPATTAPRPLPRPPPVQKSDPAPDASTTPSPGNKRRTDGFSPAGLDSLSPALPADHRPAPPHAKETASVPALLLPP